MSEPTAIAIRRFESLGERNAALVHRLEEVLTSVTTGGADVVLSGGRTPMQAYRELASHSPQLAPHLIVQFTDARSVQSTSKASNYLQSLPLINALALPEASVLRVRTELPLEDLSTAYERCTDELLLALVRFRLGLLGL